MRIGAASRALSLSLLLVLGGCALTPNEARTRIDRLVAGALDEWRDWGEQRVRSDADGRLCAVLADGSCAHVQDGCGRERSSRHCALVNRYWPLVSTYRHPCARTDVCESRLPAGESALRTEPWSAAFVSYLYRRAGFGRLEFVFSDTHADYVAATREGTMPLFELLATPFVARRGDLVCTVRGSAKAIGAPMIDWISAQWSPRPFTPMHCDLVVDVSARPGVASVVGGNVEQAVSMREVALDAAGRIDWEPPPGAGWLLGLRLRALRSDLGGIAR